MTKYQEKYTKVGGSIFNGVSPRRAKVHLRLGLRLGLKNDIEGLILNFCNVYYLQNSLCYLISLGLLNNSKIYHNNKQKNHYQIDS